MDCRTLIAFFTLAVISYTHAQNCALDILMVVDTSNSVNNNEMNDLREGLKGMVQQRMNIAPQFGNLGLCYYGTNSDTIVSLSLYRNRNFIENAIDASSQSGGTNSVSEGIECVLVQKLVSRRFGSGVPSFLIIVLDSDPTNSAELSRTRVLIDQAKRDGFFVAVFAIGNAVDIAEVRNWPTPGRFYQMSSFAAFRQYFQNVNPFRISCPTIASDVCRNCRVIGGMGFAAHPTDCGAFIQCVPEGNGWAPKARYCFAGMFWQPSQFSCQPAENVDCLSDPCRDNNRGSVVFTSPDRSYCGAYWECDRLRNRAKAVKCCPSGNAYDSGSEVCVNDNTCTDGCYWNNDPGVTFPCLFAAHPDPVNNPKKFRFYASNDIVHEYTCAFGTLWDDTSCGCHIVFDEALPTGPLDCLDLRLPLDADFVDLATNGPAGLGWYVEQGNAVIQTGVSGANGGGAAYFAGNAVVSVPRYAWADFNYLEIQFRYLLDPTLPVAGDNRDFALCTNSNCEDPSTFSISINRGNSNLEARVRAVDRAADYVLTINPQTSPNNWVSVNFRYTGTTMTLSGGGSSDSINVGGNIMPALAGLQIGDGAGYRAFEGYIDDFILYICPP